LLRVLSIRRKHRLLRSRHQHLRDEDYRGHAMPQRHRLPRVCPMRCDSNARFAHRRNRGASAWHLVTGMSESVERHVLDVQIERVDDGMGAVGGLLNVEA
jgi:hypothetical protein